MESLQVVAHGKAKALQSHEQRDRQKIQTAPCHILILGQYSAITQYITPKTTEKSVCTIKIESGISIPEKI